jgi:exonuclease SbcD
LARRFAAARAAASARDPRLPQIVLGHLVATGAALGGFERPVQVGNLASVQAADLAGDAAYLALGHLHRPQALGARETWRYSGSLLPTGFDEVASARSVVVFEVGAGAPAGVEVVPLRPFRAYRRLRGPAQELRAQILELPEPPPEAATPFCEATVEMAGPEPGLAQDLIELARQRGWALVSVKRERSALPDAGPASLVQLHELEPEEIFVKKHQSDFGTEPDDELLLAFRRLLEGLDAEAAAESG